VAPALVVATIELALFSTEWPGWREVQAVFRTLSRAIPGPNPRWPDPAAPDFGKWMDQARQLQDDARVRSALARQGLRALPRSGLRFTDERRSIYTRELGGTVALLTVLWFVAQLDDRRRWFEAALIAVTALDLWGLARQRHYDLGPVRPLAAQSPVLALLAREARGGRTIDPARNLAMVAGAAPIIAYRTLDLPVLETLARPATVPPLPSPGGSMTLGAIRATGASVVVLDPYWTGVEASLPFESDAPGWSQRRQVHDPALAGWLEGTDLAALEGPRAAAFIVWCPATRAARAWLIPLTDRRAATMLDAAPGEPEAVLSVLEAAAPLELISRTPEWVELRVVARGGAAVIVSQLADPQWQGRWIGPDGRAQPAPIRPVFRGRGRFGWQAVNVPGPGPWTLHLDYVARDVRAGLIVSGISFLVWLGLAVFLRPRRLVTEVGKTP
jgi:hypothetical protein